MSDMLTVPAATRSRGSRKSIAYQPSSSHTGGVEVEKDLIREEKENAGTTSTQSKRMRSRSLGPGELQKLVDIGKEGLGKDPFASEKVNPPEIYEPLLI